MESIKKVLHIRSKSKAEPVPEQETESGSPTRASIDSDVAAMTPDERDRYMQEMEEAEKTGGAPKKGGFLDRLIEKGNKRTEEQLAREAREREGKGGS